MTHRHGWVRTGPHLYVTGTAEDGAGVVGHDGLWTANVVVGGELERVGPFDLRDEAIDAAEEMMKARAA